jgi:prepilin-type N-terminal cleavage/methylation domain-containing protein
MSSTIREENGFTIVELMIATSVVSVLLLLATVILINVGNLYYKGITQSRVQDNARAITDEISQQLKLTSSVVTTSRGHTTSYCIGTTRYSVVVGPQIGSDATQQQSKHILWRDKLDSNSCPTPPAGSPLNKNFGGNRQFDASGSEGSELIAHRGRLTEFSISGSSPYTITINEAVADNDQLCDVNTPGECTTSAKTVQMTALINGGIAPGYEFRCKGKTSQHFCATANLTTTVVRRLN